MNTDKVLVIIVTYNAMKWATQCFDSLLKSRHEVDVYVIDNGSTDGTPEYIQKQYPKYNFFQTDKNLGFGAANNVGFRFAISNNYDYVYLLNQDAWIFEDTIEKLIGASKNNTDYGIISPMQYSGDEKKLDKGFQKIYSKAYHKNTCSSLVDVPFIMAAHWFIPINVLKKVGGFSPSFFHYGEDLNYIDRVKYHGYKIGIVNTAKSVHDRFDRPETAEKLFYLKDVLNLARLNNPKNPFIINIFTASFYACAYSLKSFCIRPIKGMVNYFHEIREIRENYNTSKEKYAFLY